MNFPPVFLAVVVSTPALAQSFNIDIEFVGGGRTNATGAPGFFFGAAAGQRGFWNAHDARLTSSVGLSDLRNRPTAATLTASNGLTTGHAHWSFNVNGNTGNYARLMNDCHIVSNVPITYTFTGLLPGSYDVYTYGARPWFRTAATHVNVLGGGAPQTITGPMTANTFAPLVTHSVHTTVVTGGTLTVIVSNPWTTGAGAYVNGFQLVHTVPTPASTAVLAFAGFAGLRRRRRA